MITDDQRQTILRAIREGASVKSASERAGVHRTRVYDDPELRREIAAARDDAHKEEPARRPPSGLSPADLTAYQRRLARQFLESLPRPGEQASRRTLAIFSGWLRGKPLPPDVDVEELARLSTRAAAEARGVEGGALADRTRGAFQRWLDGGCWPEDPLDVDVLHELSPRAAESYQRFRGIEDVEAAVNEDPPAPEPEPQLSREQLALAQFQREGIWTDDGLNLGLLGALDPAAAEDFTSWRDGHQDDFDEPEGDDPSPLRWRDFGQHAGTDAWDEDPEPTAWS